MGMKEECDRMTDIIISCWDCNQELDENGKPIDGLTFDERLEKRTKELEEDDQNLMNHIIEGA